jgi:RecA/RadA recombinase
METPTHQFKAYEGIEERIKQGTDVGLIVIDSFNALFRSTYTGRETLPNRSAESGRHIGYLQRLASKYNIAIVVTMQVMGVPDSGTSLGCIKKYGISTPPVTSNVVKHGVNYMIGLEQVSSVDKTWSAVIADGPVPRGKTMFVINEIGVTDYYDSKKR